MRTLYISDKLEKELAVRFEQIAKEKVYYGDNREDFNLVFAQENGFPLEPRIVGKWFRKWQDDNTHLNLPYLRFHDIRHSSCTFKLAVSGGDIKSVQGDTGHANATTLLNIYGHTQDKRRKALSVEAYRQFYSGQDADNDTDAENIVDLIKNNTDLQKKVISALISN